MALQAVQQQKTFPPLPSSYKQEALYITLPIAYEK
jgi:hypothetical protein